MKNFAGNLNTLSIHDHHLIKCHRILTLEKLNSRKLYEIHLSLKYENPTYQAYHEKKYDNQNFDWKVIYGIPRTTQKFLSSSINSSIMFYILIKSYINSEFSLALNVPSVIYIMKQRCIYLMNVIMHKIHGTNLDYILQKKLIYRY